MWHRCKRREMQYKVLVRKLEEKRSLGRPGHRQEDNIKVDLKLDMSVWTGVIWLMTVISDGLL